MPYYITDKSESCPAWSVIKEDGEVLACHDTKESAIDQAIAVSLAEETEFVGERAAVGQLQVGDYVSWNERNPNILAEVVIVEGQLAVLEIYELEDDVYHSTDRLMIMNVFKLVRVPRPEMISEEVEDVEEQESEEQDLEEETEGNLPDNYRPALSPDVPEGRACGNCFFYNEERLNEDGDKAWCERWDAFVEGGNYCNAWQASDAVAEERQVNLDPPAYMRAAARRGLEYYAEGLAGDGLVDRTVREARAMAAGNVTADKWVRIRAWIARHLVDLDSPDANPSSENYPSAGVVAHLLWGSGPSKSSARRALNYAEGVVARLEEENRASISQESEQMAKIEKRTNEVKFELRAVEGGDGMTFTGYAAVFNSPSEPLPFIERIAPGAFKRSLKARNDIKLLWNHDTGSVLGSTRAGTLKLEEDNYGLRVTAVLPETTLGKDVRTLVQRGDVSAMSFGFSVPANGDTWNTDGTERTLRSVRIHEVSIVAFPAYSQTAGTASVRSFDGVAKRAEVDADQLADAMLAIEDGKDLSLEQSELLTKVIQRLTPQEEAEAEANSEDLTALELKKKKFELLMKRF
ncbi:Prohead protease [uncultured Caudovirales phage]|uniref:Prohead protease n=1 Tax=uncultured Caudovirales phage TaxID=2100421 RepID=A0A6J5NGC6_9CAUD|nr:Prohead protease [uncultured Caudovirales phage]